MNTHETARQLAFYRTSAPLGLGGWQDYLPDDAVSAIDKGVNSLLQSGFDAALNKVITSTTSGKYNLDTIRNAPLNTRKTIVVQAFEVSTTFGEFATGSLLDTTQDRFYLIAGRKLTPPYVPTTMCCDGANSYAQVLVRLKGLSQAVKAQIIRDCFADPQLGNTEVGNLAVSLLEQGGSEPPAPNVSVTPLTEAQKTAAAQVLFRTVSEAANRHGLNAAPLFKLRGEKWFEDWEKRMERGKLSLKYLPNRRVSQKSTLPTSIKWAAGILGVVVVGGTLYLMSGD